MYCPHNSVLFKACLGIFHNDNHFHNTLFMTRLLLAWASSQGMYNNSIKFRSQERKLETFLLEQRIYPEIIRSYQESFQNSLMFEQGIRNHERKMQYRKKKDDTMELATTIHHTHTTILPIKEKLLDDTVNRETNSTTNNIQMESIIQNNEIGDNRTNIQHTSEFTPMTTITKKNQTTKKSHYRYPPDPLIPAVRWDVNQVVIETNVRYVSLYIYIIPLIFAWKMTINKKKRTRRRIQKIKRMSQIISP